MPSAHPWSLASPGGKDKAQKSWAMSQKLGTELGAMTLDISSILLSESTCYVCNGHIPRTQTSVSSFVKGENCTYLIVSKIKWGNTGKRLAQCPAESKFLVIGAYSYQLVPREEPMLHCLLPCLTGGSYRLAAANLVVVRRPISLGEKITIKILVPHGGNGVTKWAQRGSMLWVS